MYCMQSKLKSCPKSESSINAGGCSFNSFLRRTVRFVGTYESHLLPSVFPSFSRPPSRVFWNWGRIKKSTAFPVLHCCGNVSPGGSFQRLLLLSKHIIFHRRAPLMLTKMIKKLFIIETTQNRCRCCFGAAALNMGIR